MTDTTSSARRLTVSKSYPKPLSPASASPESLRSTVRCASANGTRPAAIRS